MSFTKRPIVVNFAFVLATSLTACAEHRYYSNAPGALRHINLSTISCQDYQPWPIDEYELFGLTEKEILSKWDVHIPHDGGYVGLGKTQSGQTFNLHWDNEKKVCAVQREFKNCTCNYFGPWLESKEEALKYSIDGLSKYDNPETNAKRHEAEKLLAQLTTH